MNQEKIIQLIQTEISDAQVQILDPLNDGVHLQCIIKSESLKKLSRIERQRQINNIIKPYLDSGELHALGIRIV